MNCDNAHLPECKAEILNPESIMNQSHSHRHVWVAHGLIGFLTFGILVPLSLLSSTCKDVLVPHHWMYLQGYINLLVIITVSIAIGTMHSMGRVGEAHSKERHHIVGLLLLLLVSLQTAVNAFLRRPRRVVDTMADNEGEVLFVKTSGTYWKYINVLFGLLIFALGASQIHAGINLFTTRYGTANWGKYIYNAWFVLLIICVWVRIRGRIVNYAAGPSSMSSASTTEVQLPPYDSIDQRDERSSISNKNGHIWTNIT